MLIYFCSLKFKLTQPMKNKLSVVILILYVCNMSFGQNNESLLLNGCDNCVVVEQSNETLQEIDELTIEAWVNPNCETGNNILVAKQWCNGDFSFSLSINEGKLFWVASQSGFCTDPNFLSSVQKVVPVGVFTHVAVVYNQTETKMYINGQLTPSVWTQGGQTSIYPSTEPIRIGCYKNLAGNGSNFFSGLLNRVRIWEKALNIEEINTVKDQIINTNTPDVLINFNMYFNGTFGPNFEIANNVNGKEFLKAKSLFSNSTLPAIINNEAYQNISIGLPDDIVSCTPLNTIQLKVNFINYKDILWSNGSKDKTINASTEGEYSVEVETELCRILRDTFILTVNEKTRINLDYSICSGDSVIVNGEIYNATGEYTQILEGEFLCDTIITINLSVSQNLEGLLEYALCDSEIIEINDQIYGESGVYFQNLVTTNGCDSLLKINIIKGLSTRSEVVYSLCNAGSYVINGITYNAPGVYEQSQTNSSGCDSIVVIKILPCVQNVTYDFQQCNALTPENSMNYDEFLPTYRNPLACGTVSMSNVYRDTPQENKHSCTNGQASTLAMCVSASTSCQFDQTDQAPVSFGFKAKPGEGSLIRFNHLEFYHLSPLQYNWIQGASGPNNYPTRFGIEIYKNDVLVYVQSNINTSNQWTKGKFDLFENEDFILLENDSVRIELTPYCVTNIGGDVSVWDVDNIVLFFSCEDQENRVIGGQIKNSNFATLPDFEIRRQIGNKIRVIKPENNQIIFPYNNPLNEYTFSGFSDHDITNGVSTLDLVLIQQHILGLRPITDPKKLIAADVNNDDKINSLDLITLRKVILGIYEKLPNNNSWILFPESYFENYTDPLLIPDYYMIEPGYQDINDLHFVPVKIGDIDGN